MSGYINENGESNTLSTISEYSNVIKEIVNSSGLFRTRYDQVITQLEAINNMTEQFNSAISPSLKHDLIDIMNTTTDWEHLQKKLSVDIKSKQKNTPMNLKHFDFQTDSVDTLADDLLVNMNKVMSENNIEGERNKAINKKNKKYINQFNEYKNLFIQDLDKFVDNIRACEIKAVNCMNQNVDIIKHNINELYKIHAKYAYNELHKNKNNFKEIEYVSRSGNKINIPMCKSQKQFITEAITSMLSVD